MAEIKDMHLLRELLLSRMNRICPLEGHARMEDGKKVTV
jgi:hypothetical protein